MWTCIWPIWRDDIAIVLPVSTALGSSIVRVYGYEEKKYHTTERVVVCRGMYEYIYVCWEKAQQTQNTGAEGVSNGIRKDDRMGERNVLYKKNVVCCGVVAWAGYWDPCSRWEAVPSQTYDVHGQYLSRVHIEPCCLLRVSLLTDIVCSSPHIYTHTYHLPGLLILILYYYCFVYC